MRVKECRRFFAVLVAFTFLIISYSVIMPVTVYSEGEVIDVTLTPNVYPIVTPEPAKETPVAATSEELDKESTSEPDSIDETGYKEVQPKGIVTTEDGFVFDTSTGTITGYTGSATTLDIPGSINGVSVTVIGDNAFSYNDSICFITIPDSIETIASGAFISCDNLTNITIPRNVSSISNTAFIYNDGLANIYVDDDNSWYKDIDGVLFNKSGTMIMKHPGNRTASSYTIPDGVTIVDDNAFFACRNLVSISIPEGVTTIGQRSFIYCTNLLTLTLPSSIREIVDQSTVFINCDSLTDIFVDIDNNYYKDINGVLFSKDGQTLIKYPRKKTDEAYTVPSGVKFIEELSFSPCKDITEVIMPYGLMTIGKNAFCGCDGLVKVTVPDSVTSMGQGAFLFCDNLSEIVLSKNLTSIQDDTFAYCDNLTSAYIYSGVTEISDSAFVYCDNVTIYGESDSYAQSYASANSIPFIVLSLPSNFISYTEKESFFYDEDITLFWTESTNAVSYGLTVSKYPYGSENAVWESDDLTETSVNIGQLPAGDYRFNMVARNAAGESELTELTYFTVENISINHIYVTGVNIDTSIFRLNIGTELKLQTTISPIDATNSNVTWKSSDLSVAVVDDNGIVTAIAEGIATISVFTEEGDFTDSITFSVDANSTIIDNFGSSQYLSVLYDGSFIATYLDAEGYLTITKFSNEGGLLWITRTEEVDPCVSVVQLNSDTLIVLLYSRDVNDCIGINPNTGELITEYNQSLHSSKYSYVINAISTSDGGMFVSMRRVIYYSVGEGLDFIKFDKDLNQEWIVSADMGKAGNVGNLIEYEDTYLGVGDSLYFIIDKEGNKLKEVEYSIHSGIYQTNNLFETDTGLQCFGYHYIYSYGSLPTYPATFQYNLGEFLQINNELKYSTAYGYYDGSIFSDTAKLGEDYFCVVNTVTDSGEETYRLACMNSDLDIVWDLYLFDRSTNKNVNVESNSYGIALLGSDNDLGRIMLKYYNDLSAIKPHYTIDYSTTEKEIIKNYEGDMPLTDEVIIEINNIQMDDPKVNCTIYKVVGETIIETIEPEVAIDKFENSILLRFKNPGSQWLDYAGQNKLEFELNDGSTILYKEAFFETENIQCEDVSRVYNPNVGEVSNQELLEYLMLAMVTYREYVPQYNKKIYDVEDVYINDYKDEDNPDPRIWTNNDVTDAEMIKSFAGDYKLVYYVDNEEVLGGFDAAAYYNEESNKVVIAYRGSECLFSHTGTYDWLTDAMFAALNRLNFQFDLALAFYSKIVELYPDAEIILTGHSLGGALAEVVSIVKDVEAHTFDGANSHVVDLAYLFFVDNWNDNVFKGVDKWKATNYIDDFSSGELAETIQYGDLGEYIYNAFFTPYTDNITVTHPSFLIRHYGFTIINYNGGKVGLNYLRTEEPLRDWKVGVCTVNTHLPEYVNSFMPMKLAIVKAILEYDTRKLILGTSDADNISIFNESIYNIIYGGDGNDNINIYSIMGNVISGDSGNDYIISRLKSRDVYFYNKGDGLDVIVDFRGNENIHLFGFSAEDEISCSYTDEYNTIMCNNEPIIQIYRNRIFAQDNSVELHIYNEDNLFQESIMIENWNSWQDAKEITVMCPVNVNVYTLAGELIITLEDGVEGYWTNEHGVFSVVRDEETGDYIKTIYVDGNDYKIEVVGQETGEVDYIIADLNEDGIPEKTYFFKGVEVKADSILETTSNIDEGNSVTMDVDFNNDGNVEIFEAESKINVTNVEFGEENISIEIDEQYNTNVMALPADADNKNVTYKTSDVNIATVSEYGVITAIDAGLCTVWAISQDNENVVGSIQVIVIRHVESVTLNISSITICDDEILGIKPSFTPYDTTNRNIIWSSGDENIAVVSEDGVVTAIGAGTVTITAVTEDGGFSAECIIKVISYDVNNDETIDLLDMVYIAKSYNTNNDDLDFNHDGIINLFDLVLFARKY